MLMETDEQIGFHAFALSKSNVLKLYFANFIWFFNVLLLSTITIPILLNHVTSLYLEYVCTNEIDEQIGFHAVVLSKSNVLELYFANFDCFFNVLR